MNTVKLKPMSYICEATSTCICIRAICMHVHQVRYGGKFREDARSSERERQKYNSVVFRKYSCSSKVGAKREHGLQSMEMGKGVKTFRKQ